MEHDAPPSGPARRTRGALLLVPAVLGTAGAAYALRGPLMMAAPRCTAGRWHGCLDTFNGVVLMTLVALPLAGLVAWALARRRGAGRWPRWPWSTGRCRSCG